MNEVQLAAAKKAGLAVLVAICFMLLFKMSPVLAIMLVFLSGVGGASYMFFMDMEAEKIRKAEHEAMLQKIRSEREELLDRNRH